MTAIDGAGVEGPRVVLDARWWHINGTGAFTRALVRGLAEVHPSGRWIVWGPPAAGELAWPGCEHRCSVADPASVLGQRQAFRVPHGDLVIHPHQIRPVHRRPAASCVLDLIQLEHAGIGTRRLREQWLQTTIEHAAVLFAIAPSVRDRLVTEHGVDPSGIHVLHLPVDASAAARVRAGRAAVPMADRTTRRPLVAVGRAAPHKNHGRLVEAFANSQFAAMGGQLHLIGLDADRLPKGGTGLHPGVRVLGEVSQVMLDDALAGALALVQPSLAEGYGLPVAEALAAGVPVVSSPIPAVTEMGPAGVPVFDPRSVSSMTDAIDKTVQLVDQGRYWEQVDQEAWLRRQPTDVDLARQVLAGIVDVVGDLLPHDGAPAAGPDRLAS